MSPRILVVEDDPSLRSFLTKAITRLGYSVSSAESGAAALEAFQLHQDIDLLLTDIEIGGTTDGFEVAAQLRRVAPGLRVLFTSGSGDPAVAQRAAALSHAEPLRKPFGLAALEQALRSALEP